jgi:hypothetical protein
VGGTRSLTTRELADLENLRRSEGSPILGAIR